MIQDSGYIPSLSVIQHSQVEVSSVLFIVFSKLITIIAILLLPSLINQQPSSWIIALLAAFDLWITKNSARKFLHINWYVDSNLSTDRWVFEAGLSAPSHAFEVIFCYAFLMYGIFLGCMLLMNLALMRFSLAVAILIGFVCNFVSAYVYFKVTKIRRKGTLNKVAMAKSVTGNDLALFKSVKLIPKSRNHTSSIYM